MTLLYYDVNYCKNIMENIFFECMVINIFTIA